MKWYIMVTVAFFVLIICSLINTDPELTRDNLQPFSSKARFLPLPDDTDLPDIPENIPKIYKQKCKIDDVNSCSKYPNTVCERFDKETKVHFSTDSSRSTIIKNKDPNEGYCMNIHHLSNRCNIFHGYWALIKKSNEDNSYMKVCVCYRPGYIGNLKLFDACETPFICDGKVNDINNKFESIECVCKKEEESTRFKNKDDDVEFPVCTPKKITNVVNWASILIPPEFKDNLIDADAHYPADIASNIKPLDKLIDPCSICPLTGQQTGAEAIHAFSGSDATVFCATRKRDWGIPFRRRPDNRLLRGNFGPDGVLALKWDKIIVEDDGVGTNPQRFTYIISPCNENKKFYDTLNIEYKQFAINVGENNFLSVTILPKSSFIPTPIWVMLMGIMELH
uniref:Putative per os infectivity factor PIF-1 n=1 Tax=Chelonus inanitus TaxID=49201 RepID=B9W4A9_9HYME|nr:putative per os infectivity factor PIF-1 [Chelonus inanitus]